MRLAANFALRRESAIVRLLFFLAPLITLIAPLTTVPVLVVLSAGCIALALLRSTGEPRRITTTFLSGLLVAAIGGVMANGATSDNALLSRLAEILPTPIVLVGSWVMLAAVARLGLLSIREPQGR